MGLEIATFDTALNTTFDAVAEAAVTWDIHYRQVQAGANPCGFAQLITSNFELAVERFERLVSVSGSRPDGWIWFALAADVNGRVHLGGRAHDAHKLLCPPPKSDVDLLYGSLITFVVPEEPLALRMGRPRYRRAISHGSLAVPPSVANRFRESAYDVLRAHGDQPLLGASSAASASAGGMLADQIVSMLSLGTPEASGCETLPRRIEIAKRAEEFALERLDEPVGMSDLIEHCGASERTIRAGFLDRFGHGPKAHLTSLRLNAARSRLRADARGDVTVAETAHRFGFWHLGRFAGAYRRHFGELPSETLRAAQRESAR